MPCPSSRLRALLVAALVACAGLVLTGCTLIGFGIGSVVDSKRPSTPRVLPSIEVQRIRVGERVKLFLRDGATREGRYEGLAPLYSPEYATRYDQARAAQGPKALPALGMAAEITRRGGKVELGAFHGFEPGAVLLIRKGEAGARTLPFTEVAKLSWMETAVEGETLATRMNAGQLPCRSRLTVEGEKIPIEAVDRLEMPAWGRHSAAKRGALIGAVVDAVVLLAAAASMGGASYEISTPNTSCPFVYAWDGNTYHREAEMYGGAMLEALARSDRAPLARLRPQDGRFRLRVTNEQDEIDYLDRVALLEIATPPGTQVVTTPEGGLAAFGALAAPRLASDRQGRDLRLTLVAEDGAEWVSDPLGLDPQRDGPRDFLVLEFDRPAGASQARLLFTLRSTAWGASLLADVLGLQGRELPAYYARLESDEAERRRFVTAWAREGLPQIEVWDGSAYRHAGFLRNLGPVPRSQALVVAVPPAGGDALRVRLGSTAGLWRVDVAAVDFSPEPPLRTRELRLLSARTRSGELVTEQVRARDGRAHTMPPGATAIELEFTASGESRNGVLGSRAYAVEVSGHYRILLPAQGDPELATYARILDEPGAFGRRALGQLRRDILLSARGGVAP